MWKEEVNSKFLKFTSNKKIQKEFEFGKKKDLFPIYSMYSPVLVLLKKSSKREV